MEQKQVVGSVAESTYDAFLQNINQRFAKLTQGQALFTTDATGLFDAYLLGFSESRRQYHNCNACRHFINRFGGLVTINESGYIKSPFWCEEEIPAEYQVSVGAVHRIVRRAQVNGVFLSKDAVWGTPVTGPWTHFAVQPTRDMLFGRSLLTPSQAMAEKREDFKNVRRALAEFPVKVVEQAVALLRSEALYRSEKILGAAEWLLALHEAIAKSHHAANMIWRAVADAPSGFCHPRSSMIGTLLEDLAAGLAFDDVSNRFAAKMHPLAYQRPQAVPAAGNIAQAEKLFEQLGLGPALRRRVARVEEVPKLWEPKKRETAPLEGLFGHLKPKGETRAELSVPVTRVTWDKFARTVLPVAETIEMQITANTRRFVVIVTAEEQESAPLLQWDSEECRNPFSWYCWHGGADPGCYGLSSGWTRVVGITRLPARWHDDGDRFKHHGDGAILLLEGARETRRGGLALFPETLRSELHQVRTTIEAHSMSGTVSGWKDGSAVGYDLRANAEWGNVLVRVKSGALMSQYLLERWD